MCAKTDREYTLIGHPLPTSQCRAQIQSVCDKPGETCPISWFSKQKLLSFQNVSGTFACMFTSACVQIPIFPDIYVHIYIYTYNISTLYLHLHTHTHVHLQIHIHTYACTCTCTYSMHTSILFYISPPPFCLTPVARAQ